MTGAIEVHLCLVKEKDPTDIIYPIPDWIDPFAYSIFDCYGYSICDNYREPQDGEIPQFVFSNRIIENPYRQSDEDPETVIQRIAGMME